MSVASLSERYKFWLCDIWGVVHNGIRAFPGTCDALVRHRQNGGTIVLVTNAPRPSSVIVPRLHELGAGPDCYDAMVSSGDVTQALVSAHQGKKVYHLGPEKDLALLEGLPVNFATADQSEAILCSGLLDDQKETPEDYDEILQSLAARGMPMICANPDKVVRYGDRLIPCAGALAERYEAMGGDVQMAGKPYEPIYREAVRLGEDAAGVCFAKKDILAIGDSLATDIKGAADFGVDVLFIVNGIHERELAEKGKESFLRKVTETVPGANIASVLGQLSWTD